ncbi:PIN domain-containing protein [Thermococcus sp.]|uniref:type II toxin-antitoxin system VapC family toxin n=1 Tax=Thermococcus sp. TaxID=35749 RepID=UPI00263230F8|nr:PIN domain-containing protein [Thermococcus sp.]
MAPKKREWLVLPDTNFLLVPGQFGVDILGELNRILDVRFRVIVPNVVLQELEVIERKSRGRDLMAIKMARKLAERFEVIEIGRFGERPIDDQILDFAMNNERIIVCTNDKGLKKRLRAMGIPVVYLRSKRILEFEGVLE